MTEDWLYSKEIKYSGNYEKNIPIKGWYISSATPKTKHKRLSVMGLDFRLTSEIILDIWQQVIHNPRVC